MHTRNFLRSCYHGLVGRASVKLLGAIFSAGLAFSLTTYAVHEIGVFELDNGTTGANAIDQSTITNPDAGSPNPDDWAQNNFNNLGNCPDPDGAGPLLAPSSCGYVSGPNVDPANPGGSAFRSLFIQDPNGIANTDSVFTQGGSKDDLDVSQWRWTTSSAPDKDDLLPVGAAAYLNGDLLIYLYGTLFAPNGDAAIGAWLFKKNIGTCDDGTFGVVDSNGNCLATQPADLHTIGDVFIVAQNSNGGRNVEMQVYKWVGADAAARAACVADGGTLTPPLDNLCQVLNDTTATCNSGLTGDDACGSMNVGAVRKGDPDFPTESPDDWGFQSKFPPPDGPALPAGTDGIGNDDFPGTSLFEAGLNFSNLFPGEAGCFNSFLMNTRASTSVRAVLKDLALGNFPLCGIDVDKTGPEKSKVGDIATYSFTITNTGAVTLYLDTVVDDVIGDLEAAAVLAGCDTLAPNGSPGDSCTFDVDYTVQASDPDPLTNTVTVHYNSAADLSGDDQSATDDHTVELFQPSVTIDKSGDTLSKIGDSVKYTITVNNTSSPDSPDLVCDITDTLLGTLAEDVSLASGSDPYVIETSRVVQEGDPDPLVNTATVTCSPEGFPNVLTDSDDHSVNLFQPSVTVDKSGDTLSKVGDPVNYTFLVTNTGSDDSPALVNGTIVDTLLGNLLDPANPSVTGSDCTATLAFGESCTISATRTVQAGDPDPLPNTVTVHYNPDGFTNDITDSDDHTVNLFQPGVTVVKSGDTLSKVGDPVNYSITVTNDSSDDSPALVDGTIVDTLLGNLLDPANPSVTGSDCTATLAFGESCTISATRTVQAGDPDPLPNTVTVHYKPDGFTNDITASDDHTVNLFQPSVIVDKTADCDVLGVAVGADITYSYTITNTSSPDSPALNLVSISDDVLGDLAADAPASCDSLASGASCNFTKVQSTSLLPVGPLTNTVNVLYNPAGFPNEITANDSQSCEIILPAPARVVIEKVLLNAENVLFDYSDTNLTVQNQYPPGEPVIPGVGSFSLTPLFVPPLGFEQNAASPFAAPTGAPNGFATTIEIVVDIPDITQPVQSSVTEDSPLPQFIVFDSLTCQAGVDANGNPLSLAGSNVVGETATLTLGSGDFAFCRYVNSFQPGDQGCTPGFWKNHLTAWVPTGYLPDQALSTVFDFGGNFSGLADDSMLDALNYQGGNGKLGAARILLRAAVAAVLNAAHPDVQYSLTLGDVIADVSAQLQTGTRDSMLVLATELDNANNGVLLPDTGGTEECPL